jgi:SAM-dependent methyltransferase
MSSHHHHHDHAGHNAHHSTFAEANKHHFDSSAQSYDDQPQVVEITRQLSRAMLEAYPFDESTTLVMDYACGTGMSTLHLSLRCPAQSRQSTQGLISRQLAPHAKSIIGVDISQGMVDQYNLRVWNQGIPAEEMRAVCVELKGVQGELDDLKFDAIVVRFTFCQFLAQNLLTRRLHNKCALAYHHFESIAEVTRTLAYFLKPGGSLLVADILRPSSTSTGSDDQHSGHPPLFPETYHHIVPHKHAFSESDVREAYDAAGLCHFRFNVIDQLPNCQMHGRGMNFFLAKGTKAEQV